MRVANVVLGDSNYKPDWRRLRDWLKRQSPDIVTLQKIGLGEPCSEEELRKIGYESWFLPHSKNYLGVAVLAHHKFLNRRSLSPSEVAYPELPDANINEPQFPNESRFLTVCIGSLWISSVYAPWGPKRLGKQGAIERRVAWLNRLRDNVRVAGHNRWMLCGDFNVKPDGKQPWTGFYSQDDKDALGEIKNLGFCDLYRKAHPNPLEKPGEHSWLRSRPQKECAPPPDSCEQEPDTVPPIRMRGPRVKVLAPKKRTAAHREIG